MSSDQMAAPEWLTEWLPRDLSRAQRVNLTAGLLIGLQIALRAWASLGSWFYSDDFIFLKDASGQKLTWQFLFTPHDSHLMPFGVFITWIVAQAGAFNWTLAAIITVLLQAVASASCYFMLRRIFGNTWLILLPLGFYLFSTMSLDGFIWWAAALNVLPLQIAFFLTIAWEVDFLRTRRPAFAYAAFAAFAFGLLADPRGMIVITTMTFIPPFFFASGSPWRRFLWTLKVSWRLWAPVGALGAGYLFLYSRLAPSPVSGGGEGDILTLAKTMLGKSYLTSLVGGPWHWDNPNPPMGRVDPPLALLIIAAIIVATLVLANLMASPRTTLTALTIVAVPLSITFLGAAFGRATQLGAYTGLLMRFLADSLPVSALALGLAFIPIKGATLLPVPLRHRWLNRQRGTRLIAIGCALFMLGSLISTVRYVMLWHTDYPARSFVANARNSIAQDPEVFADVPVPEKVQSPLSYPNNLPSSLLYPLGKKFHSSDSGNDLRVFDNKGISRQLAISEKSVVAKGPVPDCGYKIWLKPVAVQMDGLKDAVFWWASVSYLASDEGHIEVRADGRKVASMKLLPGIHTYYFKGEKPLSQFKFMNTTPDVGACIGNVIVGDPVPMP